MESRSHDAPLHANLNQLQTQKNNNNQNMG